jgi:hypothetical protein
MDYVANYRRVIKYFMSEGICFMVRKSKVPIKSAIAIKVPQINIYKTMP